MATILRVKRRNDDEPLDALVVACKRLKTESTDDSSVPLTAVAKFAGTVQSQEDVLEHVVKKVSKEELKANYKQHTSDILNKARLQTKEASKDSRYRVINCFRSLALANNEEIDDNEMTIIDVEDSVSCCRKPATETEEAEYVYDLYLSQSGEKVEVDDHFDVRPLHQELVYDNSTEGNDQEDGESEDSNSESNWRNEYPDSEGSDNSVTFDDMVEAVQKCRIEGSDLSSDDEDVCENTFAYSVDEEDVDRYGLKYAKFKAQMQYERDSDSDASDGSGLAITEIYSDEED